MRDIDKKIIVMISRIILSANIFVLSIFFARVLSKSDYGTYIQFNMIMHLSVMLLSIGIPTSLFYFLPKDNNQKYLILRSFFTLFLLGTLSACLIYYFKQDICIMLNNAGLANYMHLVGVCIICTMCSNIIRPILMVAKELIVVAFIDTARALLFFSSIVICLFINAEVKSLVYVLTVNSLIGFLTIIWVIAKYSSLYSKSLDAAIISLKEQLKFCLPLAAVGFLWLLGREVDKYIVSYFLNPADLAVYSRGALELPLIHIIAGTLAQIYLPDWVRLFDKGEYAQIMHIWHSTITKTALIIFPIFVLFQIISYEFIVSLYSTAYAGSVVIFSVYLFLLPLQLTQYTAIVESSGKPIYISIGFAAQIVFNIVLSVILIQRLGSIGPAIVTVVSMYCWTGYILFIISKIYGFKMRLVFPWRRLSKILGINIGIGFILLLLKKTGESFELFGFLGNNEIMYMGKMVIIGFLYMFLYLAILYKANMLDDDDKATIYRWLMMEKIRIRLRKVHQE